MPVQLSVCTGDIPTEDSGRQFGLLHVFSSAGITDLFSSGALGVCQLATDNLKGEEERL